MTQTTTDAMTAKAKTERIKASAKRAAKAQAKEEAAKQPEATKADPAPKQPKPKGDIDAAHAEIREMVAKEAARRLCLCGCGANTPTGFFKPGHDAKVLSAIVARQKAAQTVAA